MSCQSKFVPLCAPFLIGVFCWSCSMSFDVLPSGVGTNIRLEFVQRDGSKGDGRQCVSELIVAEEEWPDRGFGPVAWQIEAIGDCTLLTGIDIGHVPEGFAEVVNRLPLKRGRMYSASVHGMSVQGGYLPWFVCQKAPAVVGWKNENHLSNPPGNCGPA